MKCNVEIEAWQNPNTQGSSEQLTAVTAMIQENFPFYNLITTVTGYFC
jgi:hypothetical protein